MSGYYFKAKKDLFIRSSVMKIHQFSYEMDLNIMKKKERQRTQVLNMMLMGLRGFCVLFHDSYIPGITKSCLLNRW